MSPYQKRHQHLTPDTSFRLSPATGVSGLADAVSGGGQGWTDPAVHCPAMTDCGSIRGTLPGHRNLLRQVLPDCGCPEGASGVHAGSDTGGPRLRRPDWKRQPQTGGSMLLGLGQACRNRHRDDRSVRLVPAWPASSAALSAAGSAVSGRPDGCRSVRCPRCWRNRGRVSGRRWPPRTLPQSVGVRCYRKRSPGRRSLVRCRHCRYARVTWRCRRSPSWPRT
jgi:hypothetical protein